MLVIKFDIKFEFYETCQKHIQVILHLKIKVILTPLYYIA